MYIDSKTKADLRKEEQLMLKPYIYDFHKNNNSSDYYSHLEKEDLKDLGNAAIKELIIDKDVSLTQKNRFKLSKLFANTNIKKIKLYISSIMWLVFVSKLLKKNSSIKEIEFRFGIIHISYNHEKLVWDFFLDSINNRLVRFQKFPTLFDINISKIFKEINFIEIPCLKKESSNYCIDILRFILITNRYLDEFTINGTSKILKSFDFTSYSGTIVEIHTLKLYKIQHNFYSAFIDNAYLFKTEILIIKYPKNYIKTINSIFELSNNPLNTVKSVIIINDEKIKIFEIMLKSLKAHKYKIEMIPKIFIDSERKEVKIKYNENDKTYEIDCEQKNYEDIDNYLRFNWTLKSYGTRYRSYTNLLYELFYFSENLLFLKIDFSYHNNFYEAEKKREYVRENTEILVNQMLAIFNKMKETYVHSKKIENFELTFIFNDYYTELNIFYYIILHIIIEMRIKIHTLELRNCSVIDMINFLEKHKTHEILNFDFIILKIKEINEEDIYKLYQYSHLIKGKIRLILINKNQRKSYLEYYFNFCSKLLKSSNFIHLYREYGPFEKIYYNSFTKTKNIIDYIETCKIEQEIIGMNSFLLNPKREFGFEEEENDFKFVSELFSITKESHHFLSSIIFRNSLPKSETIRKIISIYLDTNLDYKYRYKEDHYQRIEFRKNIISRKYIKYFKIHDLYVRGSEYEI